MQLECDTSFWSRLGGKSEPGEVSNRHLPLAANSDRSAHLLSYQIRTNPESIQTPFSSIPDMHVVAPLDNRRGLLPPQAHAVSATDPYFGRDNPNVLSPLQRQLVA